MVCFPFEKTTQYFPINVLGACRVQEKMLSSWPLENANSLAPTLPLVRAHRVQTSSNFHLNQRTFQISGSSVWPLIQSFYQYNGQEIVDTHVCVSNYNSYTVSRTFGFI